MWTKLTQIEFNKKKKYYFIERFIFCFIFFFIIITIYTKYDLSEIKPSVPIEWKDMIYHIPGISIFTLIISILYAVFKVKRPESLMCDKCFKIKNNDRKYLCDCGGHFVDFKLMKYIDDNNK